MTMCGFSEQAEDGHKLRRSLGYRSHLIRHKVPKTVQSKDAQKPDDQVLKPLLMLLGQL